MKRKLSPKWLVRPIGWAVFFVMGLVLFSLSGTTPPAAAQETGLTPPEPAGPIWIDPVHPPASQPLAALPPAASLRVDAQGSSQLLGNAGFDADNWSPWQTAGTPGLYTGFKYSGTRSAHLGNRDEANDQIIQAVTIPANASAVTLNFWYYLDTNESSGGYDYFYVGIWDQSGTIAHVLLYDDFSQDRNWTPVSYTLTAAEQAQVAGQKVLVAFIVQTDDNLSSRAWVDEATLTVATPDEPPPPPRSYEVYLPLLTSVRLPIITHFSANPASIAPGGASTLAWQVTGATSLSISPDVGPVSGAGVTVRPAATTQYTLTAANAAGSVTAQATVTVQTPGATSGFFLPGIPDIERPTSRPTVVVDAAGGVHVSLTPDSSAEGSTVRPALYAYCPANCSNAAAFTIIPLQDDVTYANLALDPNGRPRLLLTIGLLADQPHYQYGECNGNCTNPAEWHFTALAPYTWPNTASGVEFGRVFALDHLGRPRFVYQDWDQNHKGNFYVYCDANCTNAANWFELHLSSDLSAEKFALAMSPTGQPRLVYHTYDGAALKWYVFYAECNAADCTDGANWAGLRLANTVSASVYEFATYALRVDSGGHPHLALYTGSGQGSSLTDGQLHYLRCNSASCAPGNWQVLDLQLPYNNGEAGVDLALDQQNRPRIVYHAPLAQGYGLYYAWCNTECESLPQNWRSMEIEPSERVTQELPIPPQPGCDFPQCNPPIPACTISAWDNGFRPSLALDATGNPRIAYDAEHDQGGACGTFTDTRLTRFTLFNQL